MFNNSATAPADWTGAAFRWEGTASVASAEAQESSVSHVPHAATPEFRQRNRLLSLMTPGDVQRLEPHVRIVKSPTRRSLFRAGDPITDLHFPLDGVYGIATELFDGGSVTSALVGRHGAVGMEGILHDRAAVLGHVSLHVPPGSALAVPVAVVRRALAESRPLARLLNGYLEVHIANMLQALACQARHTAYERCCQCLLAIDDQLDPAPAERRFALTHEILALIIGSRRQTVTTLAAGLQRAGYIDYRHGRVALLDRAALEARACSCYGEARTRYESFLRTCQ